MSVIDKIWYEKGAASFLMRLPLIPFSCVFKFATAARRFLYGTEVFKSIAPDVPVVVIGGITVGGSGKTPLCVALVKELISQGYTPGVLSRGYKSKAPSYPYEVKTDDDASICGDEPLLIKRQTGARVVIDPDRSRGADALARLGVDIIITDDGMQHYSLDRDVEIAVLDGSRMLGNGMLLPAGPLREGKWRLNTVDAVVVNAAMAKSGYYTMVLRPRPPHPVNDGRNESLAKNAEVCALAGIGNPGRFYRTLEDCGYIIKDTLKAGDHERLSPEAIRSKAENLPVIMTAKDAIKYHSYDLPNVFVLEVEADLSNRFYECIMDKIKDSDNKVALRRMDAKRRLNNNEFSNK